jgi:hypothetical protein
MKKIDDIPSVVANLVYTPTLLAYAWIVVHYVWAGFCLYLIALVVAYLSGAFGAFRRWPRISKVALYVGVPFIILGLYFSLRPTSYWMLLPLALQALLSIVGGLALGSLNGTRSPA